MDGWRPMIAEHSALLLTVAGKTIANASLTTLGGGGGGGGGDHCTDGGAEES